MEIIHTVVCKRLERVGDVERAELRPLVADDGINAKLGKSRPILLVRKLVVSQAKTEVLAGVLLAKRLSSVETNAHSEISVNVQLSVEAAEEEQLESLCENGRVPVRLVEGVLVRSPGAIHVRAVDGRPVGIYQSSCVRRVCNDAVDEGLNSLPLDCRLSSNSCLVVPGSQLLNDAVHKRRHSVEGLGRLNAIIEVSARGETILLLEGSEDLVVVIAGSGFLERSDTSFTEELERSTAGLEVLLVGRWGRTSEQRRGTVCESARGLLATGEANDLAIGGVWGVCVDLGEFEGARIGEDGVVVA